VTAARVGHTSGRTVSEKPKNKVGKRVLFFVVETQDTFTRRSPRIPPQSHHKNTTPKPRILQNPPQKCPVFVKKSASTSADFFPDL
jgi:hypothetical protein